MSKYNKFKEYVKINFSEKYNKLNFEKIDDRLYYIYRVTDITKNIYYYGSRVSNKFDILNGYYTSSSMSKTIKENKDNYKSKIIRCFDNNGDKILYESFLHSYFDVKHNNSFWNKANQTPFGFDTTGVSFYGFKHSNKTKQLLSDLNSGISWEQKMGREKSIIMRDNLSKRNQQRIGEKHPLFGTEGTWLGKNHSNESKRKMSEFRKNKTYEDIYGTEKGNILRESRQGGGNPAAKSIILFDNMNNEIYRCDTVKEFKDFCRDSEYPSGLYNKNNKDKTQVYVPAKNSPKRFREFKGWYVTSN